MNFKNKFNKFKQYDEYFKDLNDEEIYALLDSSYAKIGIIGGVSGDAKDICAEVNNSIKQSVKYGVNLKNMNVKKLKKSFSELKDLLKSELSDEEKQSIELMIGLIELFIENNSSMRNW